MKYIHMPEASTIGRLLSRRLRLRRLRGKIERYPADAEVVLNWGQHPQHSVSNCRVINDPFYQTLASNKLYSFQMLHAVDVRTVPWTTDISIARQWQSEGRAIIERRTVTGSGGAGIRVIANAEIELRPVPLYTQFVPSVREYRVHVINNLVLASRKVRRNQAPEQPFPIRNHGDTWTFAYQLPREAPELVLTLARKAINALSLDFGAVDILYEGQGQASILEINTAPGLDHTVPEAFYITHLRGLIDGEIPETQVQAEGS